jgi:hypothetical protein
MKDLETGEQMLWRGRRGWNSVGLIVRKLKRGKMLASELPSRPINGCKKMEERRTWDPLITCERQLGAWQPPGAETMAPLLGTPQSHSSLVSRRVRSSAI